MQVNSGRLAWADMSDEEIASAPCLGQGGFGVGRKGWWATWEMEDATKVLEVGG